MAYSPGDVAASANPFASGFASNLIESLGTDRFGATFSETMWELAKIEHFAVFHVGDVGPMHVFSGSIDGTASAFQQSSRYIDDKLWRQDPTMVAACGSSRKNDPVPKMQNLKISDLPHGTLRDVVYASKQISDRYLLCHRTADATIGLSILRSEGQGCFSDREREVLEDWSGLLMSALDRHLKFAASLPDMSISLRSLAEIERTVCAAPESFPRREAQVCARILYGVSSIGIALDLDIGEETVMTYRKRAYQRLGIGSQRELLMWYLKTWSHVRAAYLTASSGQTAH